MKKRVFKTGIQKRVLFITLILIIALAAGACGNPPKASVAAEPVRTTVKPEEKETKAEEPSAKPGDLAAEPAAETAASANAGMSLFVEEACYDAGCEEPLYYADEFNTEEYSTIRENGFRSVVTSPLSTFAADVDTASYANLRRMIDWGYKRSEIPSGAVRAEELINYFSYDYDGPKRREPFGVNAEIGECPWNEDHLLLMLGLQTEAIDFSEAPDTNLVFLIDVSGSMYDEEKLPLLKQAFSLLVEELGEKDRVSIVTYASGTDTVLKGVSGDQHEKILRALNQLEAGGSTNGGDGILRAYDLAESHFIEGGNNRVIIASDGDFNVGMTSQSELYDLIREEKEKGIFLSVLGFGYGNYSDANMETLADNGNGNYSYIDSLKEAKKVLVEELGATLFTVAKDVKLQIEFNPLYVCEYRQIGYENRQMAAEDFEDDEKDGGEIGAGHSVTVLYEIVPAEAKEDGRSLKYQETDLSQTAKRSGEWLTLSVRYKEPDEEESVLLEYPIGGESVARKPSDDFSFAAAVAEFAMVLSDSEYLGDGSLRHVKRILDEMELEDEYREEFADLVYDLR